MITVALNANEESCSQCGHPNTVYACQQLMSVTNCCQLTINLFCVECGNVRAVSAKVEITNHELPNPCESDDSEVCDCGEPFPESGYCKFCGAYQRNRRR